MGHAKPKEGGSVPPSPMSDVSSLGELESSLLSESSSTSSLSPAEGCFTGKGAVFLAGVGPFSLADRDFIWPREGGRGFLVHADCRGEGGGRRYQI